MIDPQARSVLDEIAAQAKPMPLDRAAWLKAYREELDAIVAMQGPAPAIPTHETTCPGADGSPVRLRVYRPSETRAGPTLLFCHGGGFVAGSLDGYDIPLRHLALRSGWRIVAVDYRLAPEHPFPTAPDDCTAALRFIRDDREVDTARIAVAGDSAGGLLAAVVARRARDTGIALALQIMIYPNTDLRETDIHASRRAFDGTIVRMDELYRSLDAYLGAADRTRPDVSPLLAPDPSGLCPACLVTCEHDPLRDEAERYGARLREAGVPVEAIRLDGMIHSILQRGARIDRGDALISLLADRLQAARALETA